ncbi:hypothetical protein RJ55_02135 [Drechmeria coniospora]|nr:hypothetical protein RJ55_02135 [Drechmeria coniospora]
MDFHSKLRIMTVPSKNNMSGMNYRSDLGRPSFSLFPTDRNVCRTVSSTMAPSADIDDIDGAIGLSYTRLESESNEERNTLPQMEKLPRKFTSTTCQR